MKTFKNELTLKDFKALYADQYPRLCVYAHKYLKNLDTAKDLVQELFIKVWEDEEHLTGYFYKAIKHKCLNLLKSKRNKLTERFKLEDVNIVDIQTFLKVYDETFKTTDILQRAIDRLPDKASQVIQLSLQDLSNKEIAKQLQVSVNTVKDHKKLAYRKLRVFLKGF